MDGNTYAPFHSGLSLIESDSREPILLERWLACVLYTRAAAKWQSTFINRSAGWLHGYSRSIEKR